MPDTSYHLNSNTDPSQLSSPYAIPTPSPSDSKPMPQSHPSHMSPYVASVGRNHSQHFLGLFPTF